MHWLQHLLGFADGEGNDTPYLFWSAFAGILERLLELGVIGGLLWLRHDCHEHGCFRIGRLPVEGSPYLVCRRHHPAPPERGGIRRQYHLYIGEKPGRG